jgi:hypothetical protein
VTTLPFLFEAFVPLTVKSSNIVPHYMMLTIKILLKEMAKEVFPKLLLFTQLIKKYLTFKLTVTPKEVRVYKCAS